MIRGRSQMTQSLKGRGFSNDDELDMASDDLTINTKKVVYSGFKSSFDLKEGELRRLTTAPQSKLSLGCNPKNFFTL